MMCVTKRVRAGCAVLLSLLLLAAAGMFSLTAHAASLSDYGPGTYQMQASLSAYVNAMGGCEFGGPLLQSAELNVDNGGNATMTLHLGKGQVTIYSITCDTYVDPNPGYVTDDRGVESGTIGYYDRNGNLVTNGVTYTTSSDTALNPSNEAVHYVDSITFPVTYQSDTYALTLYINSNVMGVQFCQPNSAATATTYPATLTVYWDGSAPASSSAGTAEQAQASGEEMDGLTLYTADESAAGSADSAADAGTNGTAGTAAGTAGTDTGTAGGETAAAAAVVEEEGEFRTKEDGAEAGTVTEDAPDAADTGTESEISAVQLAAEEDSEPWVYSGANHTLLIVLVCVGGVLVCLGGISLTMNILSARKKKDDGDHHEE